MFKTSGKIVFFSFVSFCHSINLSKQAELGYVFWFTDGNGWKYNDSKVSCEAGKKTSKSKNKMKNAQIHNNIKMCGLLCNLWREGEKME